MLQDITAAQCQQKCVDNQAQGSDGQGGFERKDCKFALHDAKQPVNNRKQMVIGTSASTSKTETMHDLASYRCPTKVNKTNWVGVDHEGTAFPWANDDREFTVSVNGNDLTVSSSSAWSNMNLTFSCPHVSDYSQSQQTAGYCWLYAHLPASHETITANSNHDQYTW